MSKKTKIQDTGETISQEDCTQSVKDNFSFQLKKSYDRDEYYDSYFLGTCFESFIRNCCLQSGKLLKKNRDSFCKLGSHNQEGDFRFSDGTRGGLKSTKVEYKIGDTVHVKISMNRTTKQKTLEEKIRHVNQIYTNMSMDMWALRIYVSDKYSSVIVLKIDPKKVKEFQISRYRFETPKEDDAEWSSEIINGCYFKIPKSMSAQVWFYCNDIKLLLSKYLNNGIEIVHMEDTREKIIDVPMDFLVDDSFSFNPIDLFKSIPPYNKDLDEEHKFIDMDTMNEKNMIIAPVVDYTLEYIDYGNQ
jgi:hypothetical protein